MARQETIQVKRSERNRDQALRDAHRKAFEQIHAASAGRDRALVVQRAIEQLVDACEAYVWSREPEPQAS